MVIMRSGASTAATTARSRRLNRMRRLVRFRIPEADAALFDATSIPGKPRPDASCACQRISTTSSARGAVCSEQRGHGHIHV
jgi:hypothetical protein